MDKHDKFIQMLKKSFMKTNKYRAYRWCMLTELIKCGSQMSVKEKKSEGA